MITMTYVDERYQNFLMAYRNTLVLMQHEQDYIETSVANLRNRLAKYDFKRYGNKPIHFLHAGKRITRTYIRWAIESAPARKAYIQRLRDAFNKKCEQERERNPFFMTGSFEANHTRQLRIGFSKHKALFCI